MEGTYTSEGPFLSKMVYKGYGLDLRAEPPRVKLCSVVPLLRTTHTEANKCLPCNIYL